MPDTTIPDKSLTAILDVLDKANRRRALYRRLLARQPVHVVYGGAHLTADTAQKLGTVALRTLRACARRPCSHRPSGSMPDCVPVYPRVVEADTGAGQDFRIDFEDGFGIRPDAEEDEQARRGHRGGQRHARRDAAAVNQHQNQAAQRGTEAPEPPSRSIYSSRRCSSAAAGAARISWSRSPDRRPSRSRRLRRMRRVRCWRDIAGLAIKFELMIETTQSVFAADGTVALPA
jgi:hypothetical protein